MARKNQRSTNLQPAIEELSGGGLERNLPRGHGSTPRLHFEATRRGHELQSFQLTELAEAKPGARGQNDDGLVSMLLPIGRLRKSGDQARNIADLEGHAGRARFFLREHSRERREWIRREHPLRYLLSVHALE